MYYQLIIKPGMYIVHVQYMYRQLDTSLISSTLVLHVLTIFLRVPYSALYW